MRCRRRSSRPSRSGSSDSPRSSRDLLSIASVLGRSFEFADLEVLAEGAGRSRTRSTGSSARECSKRSGSPAATGSPSRAESCGTSSTAHSRARKRRSLHRKYAELIERRYAGRLDRIYPDLLHHFSQADNPEKTVEYGLKLARKSLDAFSAGRREPRREDGARIPRGRGVDRRPGAGGRGAAPLAEAHRTAGQRRTALCGKRRPPSGLRARAAARRRRWLPSSSRRTRPGREGGPRRPGGGRSEASTSPARAREDRTAEEAPLACRDRRQPARGICQGGRVPCRDRSADAAGEGGRRGHSERGNARRRDGEPDRIDRAGRLRNNRGARGRRRPYSRRSSRSMRRAARSLRSPRAGPQDEGSRPAPAPAAASCSPTASPDRQRREGVVRAVDRALPRCDAARPSPRSPAWTISRRQAPRRSRESALSESEIEIRLGRDALPLYPAFLTDGRTSIALGGRRDGSGAFSGPDPFGSTTARRERAVLEAQPALLEEPPRRLDRRVPAPRSPPRRSPPACAPASTTSRGTCFRRTARRSFAIRGSGRASPKRRRRTPTSSSSTPSAGGLERRPAPGALRRGPGA